MMAGPGLHEGLRAFGDGDEEGALEALIDAWRATRAREIAELVEQLSKRLEPLLPALGGTLDELEAQWTAIAPLRRAVDLPRLLESILHTTQRSGVAIVNALGMRGEALVGWPADPRSSARIAAHLRAGPFGATAKGNQPFWTRMFELVLAHDDARAIDAFATLDFARIWKGWNDVGGRIAFLQPAVHRIAAELKRRHPHGPPPLPKSLAKDVAAMGKAIASRRAAPTLRAQPAAPPPRRARASAPSAASAPTLDVGAASVALGAAGQALAAHADEAALAALLDGWRATRSPRIGDLIDAVSKRLEARARPIDGKTRQEIQDAWLAVAAQRKPADLPRLLASITHTYHRSTDALARLEALRTWPPDPRAASGAIACLEDPPFHTSSTKPFWKALIAFTVTHGDARTAGALEQIPERLGAILQAEYTDLTAIRSWFRKELSAAAAMLRSTLGATAPLGDELERACERIAAQIRSFADPGERLLAAIAAEPDNDDPRQVYADYLLEKGDPRGEHIVLQMTGRAPDRAESLLRTHIDPWLGPIARIAWAPGCDFERGFPVAIRLAGSRSEDAVARAVGCSTWATVRRVDLAGGLLPADLLRHPVMRSVSHLGLSDPEQLAALLRWDDVPYASLGFDGSFSPADFRALLGARRKLARVRAIELGGAWFDSPATAKLLLDSELGRRLECVTIIDSCDSLAPWVARLATLRIKTLRLTHDCRRGGSLELARDRKKAFAIAHAVVGSARPDGKRPLEQLTYGKLTNLLATLTPGSLSRLHVAGTPPTKAERARLESVCKRFPEVAVELGSGDAE